ncbi:uncharacterized protein METZ01_LOCUS477769, partial [marine metagenome]
VPDGHLHQASSGTTGLQSWIDFLKSYIQADFSPVGCNQFQGDILGRFKVKKFKCYG